MSDDLISRKAVLEVLYDISSKNYGNFFGYGINKACDVIEHADTAFDKEKVIKKLKHLEKDTFDYYNRYNNEMAFGESAAFRSAIEIVEKGGIERRE